MADGSSYKIRSSDGSEFGPAPLKLIKQWGSQGRIPRDAVLVPTDGGDPIPVTEVQGLRTIDTAPPMIHSPSAPPSAPPTAPEPAAVEEGDATGGVIPYKNPHALIGYYVSVAAIIPGLALLAGPIAIVLGIVGLKKKREKPHIRGTAHAIVAIVLGALTFLANATCLGAILLNASNF